MLEVIGVIAIVYVIFKLLAGPTTKTNEATDQKAYRELKEEIEQGANEYRKIALARDGRSQTRSLLIIGTFLLLIITPIILTFTSLIQSETDADINNLISEIYRSYPESPYTAATLPANLTDDFARYAELPNSWKQRGTCPEGSRGRSNSNTQCWSLLVDGDNYLTLFIHNVSKYDCKKNIQSIHTPTLRHLRLLSISDHGTASREDPIVLDGLENNDKRNKIQKMSTRCDDHDYSQLVFVF